MLGILAAFILAALVLPQSFGLTASAISLETLLLVSGVASFVPLARRSQGRMRLFWSLIALGSASGSAINCSGFITKSCCGAKCRIFSTEMCVLFLNIVPLMAALALRPHVPRDEYAARLGRLDFALLLVWWFYLYVLIVIPWQYVVADPARL